MRVPALIALLALAGPIAAGAQVMKQDKGGPQKAAPPGQLQRAIPRAFTVTTPQLSAVGLRATPRTLTTTGLTAVGLRPEPRSLTTSELSAVGLRPEQKATTPVERSREIPR